MAARNVEEISPNDWVKACAIGGRAQKVSFYTKLFSMMPHKNILTKLQRNSSSQ